MAQTGKPMNDKAIEELYAKKRKANVRMFLALLFFVFSLVALSFIVRINYIRGLAE